MCICHALLIYVHNNEADAYKSKQKEKKWYNMLVPLATPEAAS